MARVLALDYGSARCGCALSDPTATLATPLPALPRAGTRHGLRQLAELVAEHDVERVIVGLPLSLSGADSDQTRETREFAARLSTRLGPAVPVELHDERFTTALARRRGDPGDRRGGRGSEDSRAAAHLLESWLEAAGRVADPGRPGT